MLVVVIMRWVGYLNIWGLWKESGWIWEPPHRQRDRRHFLSRRQVPTRAREECVLRGPSPPVPGCWGVTVWLKNQFPLPFPPYPQHVFPVIPAEKTSGLLERLWGGLERLLLGVGPGARLVEVLVLDVPYRHPTPISSYFLPHTVPILNVPNTALNFGLVG